MMGNCLNNDPASSENKRLNKELTQEQQKDSSIKKLLFLGAGGSGKSTIFKQLKQIHGDGWSKEYRMSFLKHIEAQVIHEMKLSIECVQYSTEQEVLDGNDNKLAHGFNALQKLSADAQQACKILKAVTIDPKLDEATTEAVKILWSEDEIKSVYENRAMTRIEDSSAHFWDKLDVITASGYIPTEEDILLVRYRTTGVIEQIFTIENNTFHIFDVGGQKSERKKWIHCFENVTAVIYVVALSCYDEVMFEDENVNSMVDSLDLFDGICNNEWFAETAMILFLNKQDLFMQKLENKKSITLCPEFEGYSGDESSFEETSDYVRDAFLARNKIQNDEKKIFTHVTCATDRNNVKKVFTDVQCLIIQRSLQSAGVMDGMI